MDTVGVGFVEEDVLNGVLERSDRRRRGGVVERTIAIAGEGKMAVTTDEVVGGGRHIPRYHES